jgi:hypothetical protein
MPGVETWGAFDRGGVVACARRFGANRWLCRIIDSVQRWQPSEQQETKYQKASLRVHGISFACQPWLRLSFAQSTSLSVTSRAAHFAAVSLIFRFSDCTTD